MEETRNMFYNKINEEIRESFKDSSVNGHTDRIFEAKELLEDLYKIGTFSDDGKCLLDPRSEVSDKICMYSKETNYKNNDKLIETTVTFEKDNHEYKKYSRELITTDPILFGLTSHENRYKTTKYEITSNNGGGLK